MSSTIRRTPPAESGQAQPCAAWPCHRQHRRGQGQDHRRTGSDLSRLGRDFKIRMFQFIKHTGAHVRRAPGGHAARHPHRGAGRRFHLALQGHGPHGRPWRWSSGSIARKPSSRARRTSSSSMSSPTPCTTAGSRLSDVVETLQAAPAMRCTSSSPAGTRRRS